MDNAVTAMQILESPTPQIPYGMLLGIMIYLIHQLYIIPILYISF